jgi:putative copper export protein
MVAPFLFFLVAGNIGGDLSSAIDPLMISIAFSSKAGQAVLVLFLGFLLVSLWSYLLPKQIWTIVIAGFSCILISFSVYGHSTINGYTSQLLIVLHLLAISYWVGSFFPLRYSTYRDIEDEKLFQIAHKFGIYAVYYILVLLVAGVSLGTILVGSLNGLLYSTYGQVFLLKLSLVSILLGIGAMNKFKLVPNLQSNGNANAVKLRKSIGREIIILAFILVISSIVSTSIEPPY